MRIIIIIIIIIIINIVAIGQKLNLRSVAKWTRKFPQKYTQNFLKRGFMRLNHPRPNTAFLNIF